MFSEWGVFRKTQINFESRVFADAMSSSKKTLKPTLTDDEEDPLEALIKRWGC